MIIILLFTIVIGGQIFNGSLVYAADVWAYTDNDRNESIQVYVCTDEIQTVRDGYYVVPCKEVYKNGEVNGLIWKFQHLSDEWRYETSHMKGDHSCRVTTNSWSGIVLAIAQPYFE